MSLPMYFHGSRKHFVKGFVLKPQKDGYVYQDSYDFERYIESRRPADKLSRFKSVFLSRNIDLIDGAGGYTDAIYKVKPTRIPEPSDLAWYSDAYLEFESKTYGGTFNQQYMDLCIDKYWSGEPYHTPERSNIEYRVASAIVEELYEINVDSYELEKVESNLHAELQNE